jgi:tRNA1(Val) A37 N6-methylase TrmN6
MTPRKPYKDCVQCAESYGFKFDMSEEEYLALPSSRRIRVICRFCKEPWITELYQLAQNGGCGKCAHDRRIETRHKKERRDYETLYEYFKNINFVLLSTKEEYLVKNKKRVLKYICPFDHECKITITQFCIEREANTFACSKCVKLTNNPIKREKSEKSEKKEKKEKKEKIAKPKIIFDFDEKCDLDLSSFYKEGKISIPSKDYKQIRSHPQAVLAILKLLENFNEPIMPYIADNTLITSYRSLLLKETTVENNEVMASIYGRVFLNYFINPLFATTAKIDTKTYEECWYDMNERRLLVERSIKYDELFNNGSLFGCYGCKYGRLYNFPPNIAKTLYNHFNAKKVLDFCAGYCGRLLGFYTSNAESYVGIDPNVKVPYQKIINEIRKIDPKDKQITILNECAEDVDYSKLGPFDFIFTSPPYFNIEIYSTDETQSCIRYPLFENWLNKFLFTTLEKVEKVLEKNGYLCINIKDPKRCSIVNPMIKFLVGLGLTEKEHIKFVHSKRHKNNRYEYIYVFRKE